MSLAVLAVLASCGRRGPPVAAAQPPTISAADLHAVDGRLQVVLHCPPESRLRVERVEVAVWRSGVPVGEVHHDGGCVFDLDADVVLGEVLQLTGAVLGSYEWGQNAVLPVHLSEEVMP